MRCLVTGGAGYIGSVTASLLVDAGHDVVVVDNLSTGHRDAVPPGCGFIEADIRDGTAITDAARDRDVVLHFAAKSIVAESVANPDLYDDNNVGGSASLLRAIYAAGVRRLVFSSTAAVYGDPDEVPIVESAPTRPTNPYGETKLKVDHMIRAACAELGLAAVSLRYFNVAGAHGPLRERHEPETHLVPLILDSIMSSGEAALDVYGTDWDTPDGTCIRDYIHVVDLARAHVLALGALTPGLHHVINLGSGTGFSVREVIDTVQRVTGHTVAWRAAGRRAGDPARLVASVERAGDILGWRAEHDLDRMVADAWASARSAHAH